MVGKNESDYLSSGLNGSFAGVQNVLHNGKYITCTASIAMTAGRVVSFTGVNNNTSELSVTYCNGNVGEQNASSLPLGVTMNDVQIGGEVQVAVEGICSVLIGSTSTAQRGCMVTVGGSANSYQGRVTTTSRYGNEPSIGICLSYGSRNANQPIVVKLQGSFESY
jgi:predicted RecA/RadA family phage recombinase